MRTTEMVLFAHFLKTSKFIPGCISILSLVEDHHFGLCKDVMEGKLFQKCTHLLYFRVLSLACLWVVM